MKTKLKNSNHTNQNYPRGKRASLNFVYDDMIDNREQLDKAIDMFLKQSINN